MSQPSPHRVVVVGGGFGGVHAARALSGIGAEVTIIDRTNHHLFQPLLYQVATGVLSPGQIAPALRSLFRRHPDVRVLLAEVSDVDLEQRIVYAHGIEPLEVPYDTLIVAAGATHSYFGHDEWEGLAPGMKTLGDAIHLRSRILGAFEMAEQEDDPEARMGWLTFAIIGGGPTGVELAGQIRLLADRVLKGEYHRIDTTTARIVLLDATPTLLGPFAESLRARARRDMIGMRVDVELESPVTDVDNLGVTVGTGQESRRIAARTVIWAAGVKASPIGERLARQAGAEVDRAGRLHVRDDLSLPGHPEVFAIGDMISVDGVPGTAQPAIQEGKYVARVVKARLRGHTAHRPFRYIDLGMMAVIGRTRAVADLFGKVRIGGFPAFLIWGVIHLAYLVGWGNRFEAVSRWLWTILARNRRERLISMSSLAGDEAVAKDLEQGEASAVS
ncbi:MAG TPA: NAD(P)/FAD-dependent oxidoreductase [Solirubrobacteraceae bacterium]|nr:NAD(P)/FAD-dependent oxidoreductase [Solirubrobacteraceae bacterium]